jgi:hypothetical protein
MIHDSEDRAARAMALPSPVTPFTSVAGEVNLTDHTPPHEVRVARLFDLTYELVPRNTGEIIVAALEFEVGIANAGAQHPDERGAFRRLRHWELFSKELSIITKDYKHINVTSTSYIHRRCCVPHLILMEFYIATGFAESLR